MARPWIEIKAGKAYVGTNGTEREVTRYNPQTQRVEYRRRGIQREPEKLYACSEKAFKVWASIINVNGTLKMQEVEDGEA